MRNSRKMNHNQSVYQLIGEINGTRELANTFYDIMEQDPQVQELLAIHPLPLDNVREKFYEFLSGWLGGPPLFANKYGHPRLRKRHAPFTVSPKLKTQWMYCMDKALTQCIDNPEVVAALHQAFDDLAEHMINSVEPICPSQQQQQQQQ